MAAETQGSKDGEKGDPAWMSRRESFLPSPDARPASSHLTEKKLSTKAFIFHQIHPQLTKLLRVPYLN